MSHNFLQDQLKAESITDNVIDPRYIEKYESSHKDQQTGSFEKLEQAIEQSIKTGGVGIDDGGDGTDEKLNIQEESPYRNQQQNTNNNSNNPFVHEEDYSKGTFGSPEQPGMLF